MSVESAKRAAKSEKVKKTRRPRKQRKNPIVFLKEVWVELSTKVTWPTKKELVSYVSVIIVFVALATGIVYLMNLGLGAAFDEYFVSKPKVTGTPSPSASTSPTLEPNSVVTPTPASSIAASPTATPKVTP